MRLGRHQTGEVGALAEGYAPARKELVVAGKQVSAYGYPSRAEKDEMRAERITIDGKIVEMR